MPTELETRESNRLLFEALATPGRDKEAQDQLSEYAYTPLITREEGIMRRIMPPVPITNEQLDRATLDDKPIKIIDREPLSPGAVILTFADVPMTYYINSTRYVVSFNRIASRRFTKDIDTLRSWIADLRQIVADNALLDIKAAEDGGFINGINAALIGPNLTVPWTNVAQWVSFGGGIDRDSLVDAKKIMPSTFAHLEVVTRLFNNITIKEIEKFGRDEMGGDKSQDVFFKGWTDGTLGGCDILATIKRNLVPDGTEFQFGKIEYLGKAFSLQDIIASIKREGPMIQWWFYESMGAAIGNPAAIARVDYMYSTQT